MKKVMRFIKRRICPIMLALVIVFFSVVEAQASPAPVLPPTFEVIPGGGGMTYFDVSQAVFGATGYDVKMQDGKSFDQELWEEIWDTYELWVYDNFGNADYEYMCNEVANILADAADGTITMSKKFFESLQQYAAEAFDKIFNSDSSDDPVYADALSIIHTLAPGASVSDSTLSDLNSWYSDSVSKVGVIGFRSGSEIYLFGYSNYFSTYDSTVTNYNFNESKDYLLTLTNAVGESTSVQKLYRFRVNSSSDSSSILYDDMFHNSIYLEHFTKSDKYIFCPNGVPIDPSTGEPIPNLPRFPVEHITFDPESVPVPWDEIAPIEDPDIVKIPVPHKETDPDPEEVPDPDPIDPDPPIDPVPDPDPTDPVPPPEDDEDIVTPEEIGTLPDIAGGGGDITKLFPFCIPFDIVSLIKSMKAEKAPPVWHFEYYFKEIDYKFEVIVDMSDYEIYVKIFRSGFVILYIITLMLLTIRYSTGIVKD